MRFQWFRKLFAKPKRKGGFPDWIVKTDETRIQNLPVLFETERDKGTKFSVTEKMDGQSATYFLHRLSKRKFSRASSACTKLSFYKEKSAVIKFKGTSITSVVMSFLHST